jgi:transcriptional regulatory protein LevR
MTTPAKPVTTATPNPSTTAPPTTPVTSEPAKEVNNTEIDFEKLTQKNLELAVQVEKLETEVLELKSAKESANNGERKVFPHSQVHAIVMKHGLSTAQAELCASELAKLLS